MTITVEFIYPDDASKVIAFLGGVGTGPGTQPTGNDFPLTAAGAPDILHATKPSPENSSINVINGAVVGAPYLVDANQQIWTMAVVAGLGKAMIGSTPIVGGGSAGGIQELIVRQGNVYVIVVGGQVQYWDPGRGSLYNGALPPAWTTSGGTPPVGTPPTMPLMPTPSVIAPGSSGKVINCGSGQALATLSAAIPTALAGDTIKLAPGTYTDTPPAWHVPLLVDLGGATFDATGQTATLAFGKALLVPTADSIIQNGTILNVAMDQTVGQLTSAIRPDVGCGYLTVKNIVAHNNQCAIGHGGFPIVIDVESSDISNNGLTGTNTGGLTHDLYVGNDCVVMTLNNVIANGANEAHAIKFRGHKLIVNGGTFASAPGKPFDLPDGVTVPFSITGATIIKGANDGDHGVMAVGEESTLNGLIGAVVGSINGGTIQANCQHPTFLGQAGTISLVGVTKTGNPLETTGGIVLA